MSLPREDHRAHGLRDGLEGLEDLMDRLLDPERGCPWDRAQTLDTLRPYLLEEAHEVLESLDDPEAHRRELGDLLFQVVFHAAIRRREGHFDLEGVIEAIRSKMIRRHPHVFGAEPGGPPPDEAQLARQWAEIKARERAATGERAAGADGDHPDPLAGVPRGLPNLQRAWRIQDKAAAVGFDWPDRAGVLDKISEEIAELEGAVARGERDAVEEELGDLLFALVRYAGKLGVEPERALGRTIEKFQRRFAHMMRRCVESGVPPEAAGLEQLERLWREAKALEPGRAEE